MQFGNTTCEFGHEKFNCHAKEGTDLMSFTSAVSTLIKKADRKATPEHKGLGMKGNILFGSYLNARRVTFNLIVT